MSNNGTSLEIVTADSVCLLTVNPSASDAIPILQQHRNISGSSTPPQKPPRKLSCGDYGSTSGYRASQKRLLNSGSRANSNDDQSYHGSNSPPPVPQGIRRPSIIQDNHQSMMEPKEAMVIAVLLVVVLFVPDQRDLIMCLACLVKQPMSKKKVHQSTLTRHHQTDILIIIHNSRMKEQILIIQ